MPNYKDLKVKKIESVNFFCCPLQNSSFGLIVVRYNKQLCAGIKNCCLCSESNRDVLCADVVSMFRPNNCSSGFIAHLLRRGQKSTYIPINFDSLIAYVK